MFADSESQQTETTDNTKAWQHMFAEQFIIKCFTMFWDILQMSFTPNADWLSFGFILTSDKVQLVSVGAFETRERGERVGKNPRTGEEVKIAACKAPAFKVGKALKDAVNK